MPKPSGWRRILTVLTLASFIELVAYGRSPHSRRSTLPTIGVAPVDIPIAVGRITAGVNVIG